MVIAYSFYLQSLNILYNVFSATISSAIYIYIYSMVILAFFYFVSQVYFNFFSVVKVICIEYLWYIWIQRFIFHNNVFLPTAVRSLNLLNFTPLNNKPIRIMYSHRDPSIRKSGTANIFIKVFIFCWSIHRPLSHTISVKAYIYTANCGCLAGWDNFLFPIWS